MAKPRYTVLVLDDEVSMREYVRSVLEKNGHRVFEAKDGNEGMTIAKANPPDLVITDIVMPDKEGLETIRDIKTLYPACCVIAMSGMVYAETYLSMAQSFGAQVVLHKPFTRSELEAAVQSVMEPMKSKQKRSGGTQFE